MEQQQPATTEQQQPATMEQQQSATMEQQQPAATKMYFYGVSFYSKYELTYHDFKTSIIEKLEKQIKGKKELLDYLTGCESEKHLSQKEQRLMKRLQKQIDHLKKDINSVEKKNVSDYFPSKKRDDNKVGVADQLFIEKIREFDDRVRPLGYNGFLFSKKDTTLLLPTRSISYKQFEVEDCDWKQYMFFNSIEKCINFLQRSPEYKQYGVIKILEILEWLSKEYNREKICVKIELYCVSGDGSESAVWYPNE